MTSTSGCAEALARSRAFRELKPDDQHRLTEAFVPVHLPGGSTLMTEGDDADSMFLVHTGRLRVLVRRGGVDVAVGEIGPGEVVGEMAVLSHGSRSATVVAIRDTSLWELSKGSFDEMVVTHPTMLLELTRLLVARLHRTNASTRVESAVRSVALLPVDGGFDMEPFVTRLVASLGERVTSLDRGAAASALGIEAPDTPVGSHHESDIARWIHRAEDANDVVVYVADLDLTPWTQRCLRQADLVLLVSSGSASGTPTEAESVLLWEADSGYRPQVDLVVVHPSSTMQPMGTSRLLEYRDVHRHHHVREGSPDGFARLGRVVRGRSVGLVLGGGGARGFAHVGVIKAFHERGISIDFVGGTSAGAPAAAGVALGWDVETTIANAKHVTVDRGSLVDLTLPVVALSKGELLGSGLRDVFGDAEIEDLWYPMFCVSTDLSDGVARVHTRGSLWRSVRASMAMPGTFPPMRADDGHVLVDGGVVNNLPIDVMEGFAKGARTIAVDLRAGAHIPSQALPSNGVLSGWRVLASRLKRGSENQEVPRMVEILLRSNEVASSPHHVRADLTIRPAADAFGVLEVSAWEELIELGYRSAIDALDSWSGTTSAEKGL